MPINSSTGGYLAPSDPGPLEGEDLNNAIQAWIVGILAIKPSLVRPSYQGEQPLIPPSVPILPDIPPGATAWVAFQYTSRPSDTFPYVGHNPDDNGGQGSDTLQRNETLDLLLSFYDLGTNGQADANLARFRDGTVIPQNREPLIAQGLFFSHCEPERVAPVLFKQRWMYRVDLPIVIRREIDRTYAVENVASAQGTIQTDVGLSETIKVP